MRLAALLLVAATALTACAPAAAVSAAATPAITATAAPGLTPSATAEPTARPAASATATPEQASCANPCLQVGHAVLQRPAALPATITIDTSYRYGSTQQGTRQPHHGVEFYNASGTPVLAAADGKVVFSGMDDEIRLGLYPGFYGKVIVLEHSLPGIELPVYTLYAHLSSLQASLGKQVRAGEQIGLVGASGAALGSHLHFEVRLGENTYGATRNPELWLAPLSDPDGAPLGMLAGRVVDGLGQPLAVPLNVQYYPPGAGVPRLTYFTETYASEPEEGVNGDDEWRENFVLSDLGAGRYRITLIYNHVLYEHWAEVESGRLTLIELTLP